MDSPSPVAPEVSGNMEIPGTKSAVNLPVGGAEQQLASNAATAFLMKKLWSGFSTVREISLVKEATSTGRQNMRSWFEFFNAKKFKKPTAGKLMSKDYYTGRLLRNLQYFHINYACVFLLLFVYCILTSPLLLIGLFASCGAFYYAHMKNSVRKIAVAGYEITLMHQYGVIGFLTLILFYYIGAGSAFTWVLGASLFLILLHAAFFGIEDDGQEFAFELEEV